MSNSMTQERLKELVSYDQKTGNFYWLVDRGPRHIGDKAGTITTQGYCQMALDRKSYRSNRLAYLYMTGSHPTYQIDHINGDRADNRWVNLRDVSPSENQQNRRRPAKTNKAGLLGVFYLKNKQKWTARIRTNKKDFYIGHFDTAELAHDAYVMKKREKHSGCTL